MSSLKVRVRFLILRALPHLVINDYKAFSEFGNIVESIVMRDRETGHSRGFGFVTYSSEEGANAAVNNMNETELDGSMIHVYIANAGRGGDGGGISSIGGISGSIGGISSGIGGSRGGIGGSRGGIGGIGGFGGGYSGGGCGLGGH